MYTYKGNVHFCPTGDNSAVDKYIFEEVQSGAYLEVRSTIFGCEFGTEKSLHGKSFGYGYPIRFI
jgi:hypothetical protein